MSSLPEVYEVMRRIARCKSKPNQMYMKAEFLFCARGIELAGELTSTDRKRHTEPYGPIGKDCWLAEAKAPDLSNNDFLKILLKVNTQQLSIDKVIDDLSQPIKVGVFKIKIAKQHLEEGEQYPYRLIGVPLDPKYDPWSQEMFDYFHDAGDNYVFPFNRQDNWEYITRKDPIFAGLTYRIKKYHYNKTTGAITEIQPTEEELATCLAHPRLFKAHGERHAKTDDLIKHKKFDGFDLAAYVGWSMGSAKSVTAAPVQAGNYAEIREGWERYVHKLAVPFNYKAFNGGN